MKKTVGWLTIAPIFADVVVSPWNILIGGLLISKLNLINSLLAILIGYLILGLIFYFYGGLGFKLRKKTSELIEPVFGVKGTKLFISGILAFGQIGWFAIISQIGGSSLASLLYLPDFVGVICYVLMMVLIAALDLQRFGLVKLLITISSVALIGYLLLNINFSQLSLTGIQSQTIFWGISIIVSSLISFTSVSPDFLSELNTKRDLKLSIVCGIVFPGIITAAVGAIAFQASTSSSLNTVIMSSSIPWLGYLFNIVTNTDAAQAIYTPGNRFSYMFKLRFKLALFFAGILGLILALLNLGQQLELWLSILAAVYPAIIGITTAKYLLDYLDLKQQVNYRQAILIMIFCASLIFVLDITILSIFVAILSFSLYILLTGILEKIYLRNHD